MMPVDFPGSNIVFKKPEGMTDEQCMSLPAFIGTDEDGFPFVLECWQPSKEDMDAIAVGRPIFLKFVGKSPQPIAVFTLDENGKIN